MSTPGDYQVETHPGLGRRMLVAAGIALGLLVIGLAAAARVEQPPGIAADH